MAKFPSAEEAAAALRDVDRRRGQALEARRNSRWVYVVFGLLIFGCVAAYDFAPEWAERWSNGALAVTVVVYFVLGRTRRGAALLGQPARVPVSEVSTRFRVLSALVMLALIALVLVMTAVGDDFSVPYLHTGFGAVAAIALIGFGPQLQTWLNRLSRRRR